MSRSVEDLTALHSRGTLAIRLGLLGALLRLWRALTGYRDRDADRLVAQAVPLVAGAQQQMAAITDVYLAAVLSVQQDRPVAPVALAAELVTGRAVRDVDPAEEYRRPVVEVRTQLSRGKSLEQAAAAGERRLESLARTDLQLAKTNAARQALDRPEAPGFFQRTLVGAENCGLCVIASTQRYRKGDLLPIHPGCNCGILPISASEAPEQVLDPDLLDAMHDAVAERFGEEFVDAGARAPIPYRDVLTVRQNSEYGPVLTVTKQRFATAQAGREVDGAVYDPQIRRWVKEFDTSDADAAAGTDQE